MGGRLKLGLYKFFDGWENRSDLEGEIRSIKIFRRVGEQIRFGKKNFIIINIYVFSGVATAERIRRMHDLKISQIQIVNT